MATNIFVFQSHLRRPTRLPEHECLRMSSGTSSVYRISSSANLNWSDRAVQVVSDGIASDRSIVIGNIQSSVSIWHVYCSVSHIWVRVLRICPLIETFFFFLIRKFRSLNRYYYLYVRYLSFICFFIAVVCYVLILWAKLRVNNFGVFLLGQQTC